MMLLVLEVWIVPRCFVPQHDRKKSTSSEMSSMILVHPQILVQKKPSSDGFYILILRINFFPDHILQLLDIFTGNGRYK